MHPNLVYAMKELTHGLNNDIVITITSAETFSKKKKEEKKNLADEISQLLTRRYTLIENLKCYQIYRRCSEDGTEAAIYRILNKYGIKIEAYHRG